LRPEQGNGHQVSRNNGAPAQGRNGKAKNGKLYIPIASSREPRLVLNYPVMA